MGDRYTVKDAEAAMRTLAAEQGRPYYWEKGPQGRGVYEGSPYNDARLVGQLWTRVGNDNRAYVGAWTLDYNPIYGGCVVHEMFNDGGGVTQPMGSMRRTPREFCEAVHFAFDAIRSKVKA